MSVAAAFSTSIVRVTSVPDGVLAGAVKVTVPLVLPPSPAVIVTVGGVFRGNVRSLLPRTVYVPEMSDNTVKGMEMVEPGSMLVLLAFTWKQGRKTTIKV